MPAKQKRARNRKRKEAIAEDRKARLTEEKCRKAKELTEKPHPVGPESNEGDFRKEFCKLRDAAVLAKSGEQLAEFNEKMFSLIRIAALSGIRCVTLFSYMIPEVPESSLAQEERDSIITLAIRLFKEESGG